MERDLVMGRSLQTPWAAAIAGILLALLLTAPVPHAPRIALLMSAVCLAGCAS